MQFQGILREHGAVRSSAGLFDVSHLGKLTVEGPGAAEALHRLLPGRVADLPPWSAAYNLVLNDSGGIVDDIFVYRHPGSLEEMIRPSRPGKGSAGTFLLVPNAANAQKVFDLLASSVGGGVRVRDAQADWAIIALSGPRSREVLSGELPQAGALRLHSFVQASYGRIPVLLSRTGYTGELTFEIFVDAGQAGRVWTSLLERGRPLGVVPCGLGARDLLRLEMGYPLHGQDITPETNPVEAGLEWVIRWDKDFPGKQSLQKVRADGPVRKLVGLLAETRRIPRPGAELVHGTEVAGEVTSGNFSPSLDRGIALGYVGAALAREGTHLQARSGGKSIPVRVSRTPFLRKGQTSGTAEHGASQSGSV